MPEPTPPVPHCVSVRELLDLLAAHHLLVHPDSGFDQVPGVPTAVQVENRLTVVLSEVSHILLPFDDGVAVKRAAPEGKSTVAPYGVTSKVETIKVAPPPMKSGTITISGPAGFMGAPVYDPMKGQVGGSHYKGMKIQHAEFCQMNQLPWCESAAIKYLCRHKQKNGVQDVDKAIHYALMLRRLEYPDAPAFQPPGQ